MPRIRFRNLVIAFLGVCSMAALALGAEPTASLKKGTPDLKSAGALAFGPEGILFVGDTKGAALFAIDTGDRTAAAEKHAVEVKDLAGKVAAMLGTDPKQIAINDLAVNPLSGTVYLSVSRGRGPDAAPVLVRIHADGKPEDVSLENVRFAKAELPNVPGADNRQRAESITDLAFADGRVFIAGLSNEEFSSRLIAIPFPFSSGRFRRGGDRDLPRGARPVRDQVADSHVRHLPHQNEPYMLAAYTCTPLVKLPVADLKAGAHVKGTTIAELGNRNRPLDMIVYQKDGKDYLLMTNSSRGVMKIPTEGAGTAESITAAGRGGGTKGLGYETIAEHQGRGPDGPARQPSRRAARAREPEWRDGSQDDRIAVIFRRWLKALIFADGRGEFPSLRDLPRPGARHRADGRTEMTTPNDSPRLSGTQRNVDPRKPPSRWSGLIRPPCGPSHDQR